MPSLSLNVGLNNGRKLPFGGGAAPSGIPISTATITVLTVGGGISAALVGAYNKQSDTEWWRGGDLYLRYDGTWYFQNEDTNSFSYHPTGTNPNFIPNTGWEDGITITAA